MATSWVGSIVKTACYRAWNEEETDDKLLSHALGSTVSHDGMNHDGQESLSKKACFTATIWLDTLIWASWSAGSKKNPQNDVWLMNRYSLFSFTGQYPLIRSETHTCMCFDLDLIHWHEQAQQPTISKCCRLQISNLQVFPSAFLKTLWKTRGAAHLKPNFLSLIECQVLGITWQSVIRSRGLTRIFSSKSQRTFFISRGWFRKRPTSGCQSSTLIYVYFFSSKLTTAWHAVWAVSQPCY